MPGHWRHINGRSMLSSFISLRGKIRILESLCVISTVLIVFGSVIEGHAQSTVRPGPSNSDGKNQEQAYAPLGESGYKVPIPEIRMDQILGGRPAKPKPPQPEKDESSSPQSNIVEPAERNEPEQSERQETSVTPEPPRLPFDPAARKTVPGPILQKPNIEEPAPMVPPLPKENVSPLSAPVAPEDPMIARPPKKEVLMKRTPPTTPPLLEAQPSKETLKSIHLKAQGPPFQGRSRTFRLEAEENLKSYRDETRSPNHFLRLYLRWSRNPNRFLRLYLRRSRNPNRFLRLYRSRSRSLNRCLNRSPGPWSLL